MRLEALQKKYSKSPSYAAKHQFYCSQMPIREQRGNKYKISSLLWFCVFKKSFYDSKSVFNLSFYSIQEVLLWRNVVF